MNENTRPFAEVAAEADIANRERAWRDSGLSSSPDASTHLAFSIGWYLARVALGIPTTGQARSSSEESEHD